MLIVAQREGTCRACGGRVRRGEEVYFEAVLGVAHVEPACANGPVRYRPNKRAARCGCGAWVGPGEGTLRLLKDRGAQGGGKQWAVDCSGCVRTSSR